MNQKTRVPFSLTTTYQSSFFGRKVTCLLAIVLTLATAIFVSLMGSVVEPDFWQPVQLVNLAANLILFSFVSYVVTAPLGYSWHFFLSSVDAAVFLYAYQVSNKYVPWLISQIKERRSLILQKLFQIESSVCTKSLAQAVQNSLTRRQPQQRSKNKAPILLFQQASLLLAP